jgi:hypothetical protein
VLDLGATTIPVAFGDPSLSLVPMRGRTFVAIQDVLFYVEGDSLKTDPALQRGLSDLPRPRYMSLQLGAMGGHWPDAAWVQVNHFGERVYEAHFLRWNGSEWADARASQDGLAVAIVPLAGAWSMVVSTSPFGWVREHDPTRSLSLLHPRWPPGVAAQGRVDAAAALADGTVFTARGGHVERWSAEGTRAPFASPAPQGTAEAPVASQIVAFSPSSVFLLDVPNTERREGAPKPADARLLRFDGARWHDEPLPTPFPTKIFAGPQGALWLTHDGELFERASDGTWTALDVPAPLEEVWAAPEGDVWATGGVKLMHTRPLPAGVDLAAIVPPGEPTQYSDACDTLTALLDELPRTAPKAHDFRAQIDALAPTIGKLAGQLAFYEVTVAGKRMLAAHRQAAVDDEAVDWTLTRKVAAALVEGAAHRGAARARLVCADVASLAGARLLRAATVHPAAPKPKPEPPPRAAPASAACATPMVVLFSPGKAAPKDFDFPLTRKALAGHAELGGVRFFEVQRGGKRTIVATLPDRRRALDLITLVQQKLAGSAPALVCETPAAGSREIKVDLATGKVKP